MPVGPCSQCFLMGLLGAAGLAIDYGFWALNKNQVQSAADASALAGASRIPGRLRLPPVAPPRAQYLKNGAASRQRRRVARHQPHRQRLGHSQRVA